MKFLTNLDLVQNEVQNAVLQPLATAPSNPKLGQIYFNSGEKTLYQYDGKQWVPLPTKVSQLENDRGYITQAQVPDGVQASDAVPKMDGTGAAGVATAFARGDHAHPSDSKKLDTNGDGSQVTVAFPTAEGRVNPTTGDSLQVLFGKVLRFFKDLKTVAFTGSYSDLSDKPAIPTTAAQVQAIPAAQKGAVGGVAELDGTGKVPAIQLPSFVDDVVEGYIVGSPMGADWLSATVGGGAFAPEAGKIYIVLTAGDYERRTYRWSGMVYAPIGNDLVLGETANTAYRGDYGKVAYQHSQVAHAPANAQKNVQADWQISNTANDGYIKNKPVIPVAVHKTVETMTGVTEATFSVSGYILGVMLVDSVTKEQVMGDLSFPTATQGGNGQVSIAFSVAPPNPILAVIHSIAG